MSAPRPDPAPTPPASFPPHVLRDYALVADGARGALVGPRGDMVWLCVPTWHDDAVLAQLLGGRGAFAVTPTGSFVWGGFYESGTLVFRHRWTCRDGARVECRDALAMPSDPRRAVVLRQVRAAEGDAEVDVVLDLRAGYGTRKLRELRRDDAGRWSARTGDLRVRLTGLAGATADDDGVLRQRLRVPAGQVHDLVLEVGEGSPGEPVDCDHAWAATVHTWRSAVPDSALAAQHSVAPEEARHSYALLRGLTSDSGGMVAAATMALPEHADRGRSYDYRYAWIRDQCYAGLAMAACGDPLPLFDTLVRFVVARVLADGPALRPAYTVLGDPVPAERPVGLPGYPGGCDVAGNHVAGQFQLDACGEVLQLLATAAQHDALDVDGWRALHAVVDAVERRWDEPDAGIWEIEDDWWAHSRLECVAGLRAAARVVQPPEAGRISVLADQLLAETSRRCLHPVEGRWQRSPGKPGVDAALLRPALYGALPVDDPRSDATLAAVRRDLVVDGYVYRYSPDSLPLGEGEGAFLLCGFLLAAAEHARGDEVAAFRLFERNRAACGPPALLAEEWDVQQRQLRGNLPQAFVHAALISTAARLASPPAGPSPRSVG
ncbi:glycoside hydrolase family 15 protein [Kineococcus glutinatus]|uniref:Glycoside hydrolase family 15 protein n=1 Tax=Kineococcus glutinatus TaxID=1070872 RepID=A0ABP8V9N9_9ACTN